MMVLVTGGNGFIGRAVCASAVERGIVVRSLSRSGRPAVPGAWLEQVDWQRGNVFDSDTLTKALKGVSAVVHCIGISRERKDVGETFKRCNGDAAIAVGEAASKAAVRDFVFVSAAEKPPWAHEEYLSSKRRAELVLAKSSMRLVVLRPGLVYGEERPLAVLAARLLKAALGMKIRMPLVRGNAPIRVSRVARAVIRALQNPEIQGILEVTRIAELGETALAVHES